nr:putative class I SAM-dependent methyltransferase [uncultured bacterium]
MQLLYLKERLRRRAPGRFIEIGPGAGEITQMLLDCGWSGTSFDLGPQTIAQLGERFKKEIAELRFTPVNADFVSAAVSEKFDLVISCMVMEHLEDKDESAFMVKSAACLKPGGIMMGLVPASPAHWGIEDDIAGHCRRYTRDSLNRLVAASNWRMLHLAGLTFPVSNLLLPVSNFLVARSEKHKLAYSALARTEQSGRRTVKYKTYFPSFLGILLNGVTLLPLHLLQKLFAKSPRVLVLFFEARPEYQAAKP